MLTSCPYSPCSIGHEQNEIEQFQACGYSFKAVFTGASVGLSGCWCLKVNQKIHAMYCQETITKIAIEPPNTAVLESLSWQWTQLMSFHAVQAAKRFERESPCAAIAARGSRALPRSRGRLPSACRSIEYASVCGGA